MLNSLLFSKLLKANFNFHWQKVGARKIIPCTKCGISTTLATTIIIGFDIGDIKFYDLKHSNSASNWVKIGLNSGIIKKNNKI